MELTITNNCTCTVVDDETGDETYATECFGFEADDFDLVATEMFEPWLEIHKPAMVRINGSNMNWNHVSGWAEVEPTWEALLNALSINGDWILDFTLENNKLSVIRRSHDELGARFDLEPVFE